ncbi:MAG TPA: hypothetical protein VG164_10390 [Trebonia sp.]|nr:hypothetical protein [Trebonia sp.]
MADTRAAPRERITAERARRGKDALVSGCIALLEGRPGDVDDDLVLALGGEPGRSWTAGARWRPRWSPATTWAPHCRPSPGCGPTRSRE